MRRYVFNADAGNPDGSGQAYGDFSSWALEGPALAGERTRSDDGPGAEALPTQPSGEGVQCPLYWRLVHHVIYGVARIHDFAAG